MYFYLAYIEVKRYFRDPGALGLSLALPIALLALMLGAFGGEPSFNGTASVVDLDKSPGSARLIELIAAVPGVDVEGGQASRQVGQVAGDGDPRWVRGSGCAGRFISAGGVSPTGQRGR